MKNTPKRGAPSLVPLTSLLFLLTVALFFCLTTAAGIAARDSALTTTASQTHFAIFDLLPGKPYDVSKNNGPAALRDASPTGVLSFRDIVAAGDRILIVPEGAELPPPTPPAGVAAVGGADGCASISWDANPEPNVVVYWIYYGIQSVENGYASGYSDSLSVTTGTERMICGLTDATYYVALRAQNDFGLKSPLSAEASAQVSNGTAQGPLPPQQVTAIETDPGIVTVSWQANGEPNVATYVAYRGTRSVEQRTAASYDDSLDTGGATEAQFSGLSPGIHYFAVRAVTTTSEFSPFSTERSVDVVGGDTSPPVISDATPAPDAVDVPRNTKFFFVVSDDQSGVDIANLSVTVDGESPNNISYEGSPSRYEVTCQVPGQLSETSTVTLEVSVPDLASNQRITAWSFSTGAGVDSRKPQFCCKAQRRQKDCCIDPPAGTFAVDPYADVYVGISDDETGVDLASLEVRINDRIVPFVYEGDRFDGMIVYENIDGFTPGSTVRVVVSGCDRSSPGNCAALEEYWFTVAGGQVAEATTQIIPNGYWSNDPSRPLEIRGLPPEWTVRIFDTRGFQVRAYENREATREDWLWDFMNDGGRRVNKGLYLVRVLNSGGDVMHTGRFLVQSD